MNHYFVVQIYEILKKFVSDYKMQLPQWAIDALYQSLKHVLVSKLFVTKRAVTNTNQITKKQEIFESEEVVINDSNIIDDSMEVVIDSSNIDESMNLDETTTNDSTTSAQQMENQSN